MKNCWMFFLLCLPLYAGVLIPTPEYQIIQQLFSQEFTPIIKVLQDTSDDSKAVDVLRQIKSALEKSQEMQKFFKKIEQKHEKFIGHLDRKITEFSQQVAKHNQVGKECKEQLLALAKRVKQTTDRHEKDELTDEFRRVFKKFNANARYEQGCSVNLEEHANLLQNLNQLLQAYYSLHLNFDILCNDLTQLQKLLETLKPTQNFHGVIKTDKLLQKLLLWQQAMDTTAEVHGIMDSWVEKPDIEKLTEAIKKLRLQK